MTPYSEKLLEYATNFCPLRKSRKRKGQENDDEQDKRTEWAINYLNCSLGPGWEHYVSSPSAVSIILSSTDEDDEEES